MTKSPDGSQTGQDVRLPLSWLSKYLRLVGPLAPEWLSATKLALFCAEAAVLLGRQYLKEFEEGRQAVWVEERREWCERTRAELRSAGPAAYALLPDLARQRWPLGPFVLGQFKRPSAHVAALELADLVVRASERTSRGMWLPRPKDLPVVRASDLAPLTQEIVFEAIGTRPMPPRVHGAESAEAPPASDFRDWKTLELQALAALVTIGPNASQIAEAIGVPRTTLLSRRTFRERYKKAKAEVEQRRRGRPRGFKKRSEGGNCPAEVEAYAPDHDDED